MASEGHFDVIVHGANCFNTMASGIAGQIAKRFPGAVRADNQTEKGDIKKLGCYTLAGVNGEGAHKFIIINAYTQYSFSRLKDVFEYEKFEEFLHRLSLYIKGREGLQKTLKVGFPYIGCGLAGGNEKRIVQLLEDFAEGLPGYAEVALVRYKPASQELLGAS